MISNALLKGILRRGSNNISRGTECVVDVVGLTRPIYLFYRRTLVWYSLRRNVDVPKHLKRLVCFPVADQAGVVDATREAPRETKVRRTM